MSDQLTKQIIGAAIEVHRILGPGLLKSIYEEALCLEMELREIPHQRQKEVDVNYKGHAIKGLKAIAKLPKVATAQTLSYLKATGLKRALLLNFNEKRLVDKIKRLSL